MDEQSEFDKFTDGAAKHLKDNCQGLGLMILVHNPGSMSGIEMWVNTADPLFGVGLLRLATIAVEDHVRERTMAQIKVSSAGHLAEDIAKKQRMN